MSSSVIIAKLLEELASEVLRLPLASAEDHGDGLAVSSSSSSSTLQAYGQGTDPRLARSIRMCRRILSSYIAGDISDTSEATTCLLIRKALDAAAASRPEDGEEEGQYSSSNGYSSSSSNRHESRHHHHHHSGGSSPQAMFNMCYDQLLARNGTGAGLQRRGEVLCMLQRIASQGNVEGQAGIAGVGTAPVFFLKPNIGHYDRKEVKAITSTAQHGDRLSTVGSRRTSLSGAGGRLGGGGGAARAAPVQRSMSEVTERALIRDVLYAFQGINGKFVSLDPEKDEYEVTPALALPRWTRDLVCRMCEMGWLFQKVALYCNEHDITSLDLSNFAEKDKTGRGLVKQSFIYSMQEQLTEYYRLIAVLEAQLNAEDERDAGAGGAEGDAYGGLTLRRLLVWTTDPLARLQLMGTLTDSAGLLQGGALASCLHNHLQHGDPFVSSFVDGIMRRVCAPLFDMVKRWVFEGELLKNNDEFFVQSRDNVHQEHVWQEQYYLSEELLPAFIPLDLAKRILVIGKAINFIRLCCSDNEWIRGAMTSVALRAGALEYGDNSALRQVVQSCSDITNKRLIDLMFNQHKLKAHLLSLKRFLLLSQGDFVTSLMDQLAPVLDKQASQLKTSYLTGIVEGCLRTSNASNSEQRGGGRTAADGDDIANDECLKRVGVKLADPSAGESGWAVFSLNYHVEAPLTAVIHAQASQEYRNMFFLLWKMKRTEWELNRAFSNHMKTVHIRAEDTFPELRSILHRCSLARGEMVFFITNLSSYVMFEVLETSWKVLQERLEDPHGLDEVIAAHDAYLKTITTRGLMHEETYGPLTKLLDVIIGFCSAQNVVMYEAMKEIATRGEGAANAEKNTKEGKWGTKIGEERKGLDIEPDKLAKIAITAADFQRNFKALLLQLKNEEDVIGKTKENNEMLKYLNFRLDFNNYYETQRQQAHKEEEERKKGILDAQYDKGNATTAAPAARRTAPAPALASARVPASGVAHERGGVGSAGTAAASASGGVGTGGRSSKVRPPPPRSDPR